MCTFLQIFELSSDLGESNKLILLVDMLLVTNFVYNFVEIVDVYFRFNKVKYLQLLLFKFVVWLNMSS